MEEENKYLERVKERIEQVKSSQTIDFQYEIRMGNMSVQLNLPKRIMEQKRLLATWNEWDSNRDSVEAEEKYYNAVSPLVYINGQKLVLETTEYEAGIIDAIMSAYGDFMMLPFSLRSTMKTNAHLSLL